MEVEDLNFIDFVGLNESQVEDMKLLLNPSNINPYVEFPWDNNSDDDVLTSSKGDSNYLKDHTYGLQSIVEGDLTSQQYTFGGLAPSGAHGTNLICYDYPVAVTGQTSVPFYPPSHAPVSDNSCQNIVPHLLKANDSSLNAPDKSISSDISQINRTGNLNENVIEGIEVLNISAHVGTKAQIQATESSLRNSQYDGMNDKFLVKSTEYQETVLPATDDRYSHHISTTKLLGEAGGFHSLHNSSLPELCTETVHDLSQQAVPNCSVSINSSLSSENCYVKQSFSAPETYVQSSAFTDRSVCIEPLSKSQCHSSECTKLPPFKGEQNVSSNFSQHNSHINEQRNEVQTSQIAPAVVPRTWADVLKSKNNARTHPCVQIMAGISDKTVKQSNESKEEKETELSTTSIEEEHVCLMLGKHLQKLQLDYSAILLQPRGLINRRNWCYINATLQALLACPPFYSLLRNLPLNPVLERTKSSTPVIDSMVKLVHEFVQVSAVKEDMQPGQPFEPCHIYQMLSVLKSECVKGQQEDAEEFLSCILNGMHEEMVLVIKKYEKSRNPNSELVASNGHFEDSGDEEDWQVIGTKQKGMVTRSAVVPKSPISELLGGQIKSFLTSASGTSASIQPFFTLQLDIQSEKVTTVMEALNQLTVKEPVQGYTCTKTKQEVEAFSRIALEKLPPILILHLKRFVYNKDGGCKKVMKKTEYPINLELKKELFSQETRKLRKTDSYTLFAVVYHDGEEAVKGHYISDIYHHGSRSWNRCDDRSITTVSENQVLSYSPPRVPYLLFYQNSKSLQNPNL